MHMAFLLQNVYLVWDKHFLGQGPSLYTVVDDMHELLWKADCAIMQESDGQKQ